MDMHPLIIFQQKLNILILKSITKYDKGSKLNLYTAILRSMTFLIMKKNVPQHFCTEFAENVQWYRPETKVIVITEYISARSRLKAFNSKKSSYSNPFSKYLVCLLRFTLSTFFNNVRIWQVNIKWSINAKTFAPRFRAHITGILVQDRMGRHQAFEIVIIIRILNQFVWHTPARDC
ncbi:hypothetical protein BpHYR1_006732 [Brachionus plicatilis]|uniref:Uncharacterized protein n=1 Tax=Brachionus plicatilis TaxID=10195 RepID=A0A3M7SF10_BRAPC|nr:hypothetical protein BpHYR1_006732 [Brachionus plicatilis]